MEGNNHLPYSPDQDDAADMSVGPSFVDVSRHLLPLENGWEAPERSACSPRYEIRAYGTTGFEGRTLPLPGSVAVSSVAEVSDFDRTVADDDPKLRGHLERTTDVEARLTETLQALQQGEQ